MLIVIVIATFCGIECYNKMVHRRTFLEKCRISLKIIHNKMFSLWVLFQLKQQRIKLADFDLTQPNCCVAYWFIWFFMIFMILISFLLRLMNRLVMSQCNSINLLKISNWLPVIICSTSYIYIAIHNKFIDTIHAHLNISQYTVYISYKS